jgi:Tfp pilus assembly protein PilF/glycosyltransferase involved in cell wall biosynthesis
MHKDAINPVHLLQQAVKAFEAGNYPEAAALCETVVQKDPHSVVALNFLALVKQYQGRNEEALAHIRQAIKLVPSNAEAHRTAGGILIALERYAEAAEATRAAAKIQPDLPGLQAQLGAILVRLGQYEEALSCLEAAFQQDPNPDADFLNTFSAALEQRCDFVRAEEFARRSLQLRRDDAATLNSLGNALLGQGKLSEAVQAFDQALALKSDEPNARYNRSLALLAGGDFTRGWAEYEWRWKSGSAPARLPEFNKPAWDGGDIRGQTILVYGEQGLGDIIHFVRYIPLLADRGARVLLACTPLLHSLLRDVHGISQLLDPEKSIPAFDTHAALLSLPALLNTTLENIPAEVPYIPVPPAATFPLRSGSVGNLKVGIVWAGGGSYRNNRLRSMPLEALLPLLRLPGIQFFSLQCGPAAAELKNLPKDIAITDVGGTVTNMADTAAVMGQLDLVISVCTSTLHLAGALGRPAWGMLAYAPCWRWMRDRSDSPWYRTIKLFRQPKAGDWAGLIAQLETALRDRVGIIEKPRPVSQTSKPLYYAGQTEQAFGWGVCNAHLMAELGNLMDVRHLDHAEAGANGDALPGNLFTPLQGSECRPWTKARGQRNAGYTFFENELTPESVENARRFDVVFAGSSWCLDRLRDKGIGHSRLLIQGVDGGTFHPQPPRQGEKFVIFSGGKFEFRKGQDLVLKAFSVLSRKHPDMVLLTAWHNGWPASMDTMRSSPHIRCEWPGNDWVGQMEHLYRVNGIDPAKVMTMPQLSPGQMAQVYHLSDLGLFPNRCEGGTNLVLMEYMACGKPAIVTNATGHQDICRENNAFLLRDLRPLNIDDGAGNVIAHWVEPSLDEIIARVEYACEHRAEAQARGVAGGEEMKQWTWKRAAETIASTLNEL